MELGDFFAPEEAANEDVEDDDRDRGSCKNNGWAKRAECEGEGKADEEVGDTCDGAHYICSGGELAAFEDEDVAYIEDRTKAEDRAGVANHA